MVKSRFAPSPTGYMHIGNLRSALYEYLIAKSMGGHFILRLEDTDTARFVEGSTEVIFNTLKLVGLDHDEGPDVGGPNGPYVQSQRLPIYKKYATQLVESGQAYYCFCTKERLDTLHHEGEEGGGYDRFCRNLTPEEVKKNLGDGLPYCIRQLIPEGKTTFNDEVYGSITVDNEELDDQVLLKSDGYPTYNFANVVDDHLMEITHVVRGSEYLPSAPKYNLLYEAFGWEIPKYVHLPLILSANGGKLSKRRGDASFEDLLNMGFLKEAVLNYIALLGWSPGDNREIFSLAELVNAFDIKGLSKSPSTMDMTKLVWMNGEYFKNMDEDVFYEKALPVLKEAVKRENADYKKLADIAKTRISFLKDIPELFDFMDKLPEYDTELYVHKKMKTDKENSLTALKETLEFFKNNEVKWDNDSLYLALSDIVTKLGIKNSQILWPVRTALSGKPTSPAGASELMELLGKDESIKRIEKGIELLS
ncbi:MAG: glutamate--tRNA ligase [Clostridiales bacterium]|jgi:glutamyl-tRNA synthetase|nr:glutamate--tRNA ligase [Clostridiales bacterium]